MTRRRTRGTTSEPGERDYVGIATQYCQDVVNGKIPAGRLIRLACQRQLDDLARAESAPSWPYRFDVEAASRVCRFIERLPHIKGDLAKQRQLIRLEPWQCWILTTVFGWLRIKDGTRRFRRTYKEVARKNAKSTVSSGVGLYMLAADGEEGAEIYALATSRDQAGIVWKDGKAMVNKSPGLKKRFALEVGALAISIAARSRTFQALPGKPGDGQNPHLAIIDEYHEHKTPDAYDAMYSGMGARSQPLMWVITTAGYNRAGPCYQQRVYAVKVLGGQIKDESLFVAIYTLDDEDDWTDPKVWIKANPNLGISVDPDNLAEAVHEASHDASKQVRVLTKRLNRWVNAGTAWMNMLEWDRNANSALKLEDYRGKPAYIGLDLASKVDIAALEILIPLDDGAYVRFGRYYLPEDTVREGAHSTHAHYAGWELDGWLTLTPGNIIDFGRIKDDLRSLCSQFEVKGIAYDPFQATQLATEMLEEGLPMIETRQSTQNLSEPMKEVHALVRSGRLKHNDDPVMAWMMSNVVAHVNAKDDIYPRKETAENKIDGVVALIMALGRAMVHKNDDSIYEERGLLSF